MFFTHLKEIRRSDELTPEVLESATRLILVYFGEAKGKITELSLNALRVRSRCDSQNLFIFIDTVQDSDPMSRYELLAALGQLPSATHLAKQSGFILSVPPSAFLEGDAERVRYETYHFVDYLETNEDWDRAVARAYDDCVTSARDNSRTAELVHAARAALWRVLEEIWKKLN